MHPKNAAGNPTAFSVHKGKKETQGLAGQLPNLLVGLFNHPNGLGEKSNVLVHCCGNKEVVLSICVLLYLYCEGVAFLRKESMEPSGEPSFIRMSSATSSSWSYIAP